jgi:hypothetical protein
MFKFLRKYNKWILAVGGTLLMIVFLIPGAIRSLSRQAAQRSIVWATVGESNEEIHTDVMREAASEIKLLQGLSTVEPSASLVASLGAFQNPAVRRSRPGSSAEARSPVSRRRCSRPSRI